MDLKADGKITGLVIDSGHGCTQIAAFYDGYELPSTKYQFS